MKVLLPAILREIPGNEGRYAASSDGRIYSLKLKGVSRVKELHQRTNGHGYRMVRLHKDGTQTTHYVHRLVARAFIDNPLRKVTVNHKDGIRTNNKVENLEWATISENVLHGFRSNGRKNPGSLLTHCKFGHEFDESNTYWWGNKRICRPCGTRRKQEARTRV